MVQFIIGQFVIHQGQKQMHYSFRTVLQTLRDPPRFAEARNQRDIGFNYKE